MSAIKIVTLMACAERRCGPKLEAGKPTDLTWVSSNCGVGRQAGSAVQILVIIM